MDTIVRTSVFFITFGLLVTQALGSIAIGWSHPDVQGWWPLVLAVKCTLALLYAGVFSALAVLSSRKDFWRAVRWSACVSGLLLSHAALYYGLHIDWLAVNQGTAQLTALQAIVRSDITPYTIYAFGLLVPAAFRAHRAITLPG
jgi:hypothetical protein